MSEQAGERMSAAERAVWSKRVSERYERTSERTSEWPSTYVPIISGSEPPWLVRLNFETMRKLRQKLGRALSLEVEAKKLK